MLDHAFFDPLRSPLMTLWPLLGAGLIVLLGWFLRREWTLWSARSWAAQGARLLSRLVRARDCDEAEFLAADGAPE